MIICSCPAFAELHGGIRFAIPPYNNHKKHKKNENRQFFRVLSLAWTTFYQCEHFMLLRPTIATLHFLSFWLIVSILVIFYPIYMLVWKMLGFALAFFVPLDALLASRIPPFTVKRDVATALALDEWAEVTLTITNNTKYAYTFSCFDDYPIQCEFEQLPQTFTIGAYQQLAFTYKICPQQRGNARFTAVRFLITAPLQFLKIQRVIELITEVRIYPNFATVSKYMLMANENRLGQLGIRQLRRRGEGLEFHQLREYQKGDNLSRIDWKATARARKLISREYQDERDQRIVFLIDCGRRMLSKDGKLSHFDYSLNAILLTTYIALRQGDALGLMTFSGEHRWFAPHKGIHTFNAILNTVYDLQSEPQASDYVAAAQRLMHYQQKRSLIILVTNLQNDEDEYLQQALRLLQKKHLILLVSLQEKILNTVIDSPIQDFKQAIRYIATSDYLQQRHALHQLLNQQGIFHINTEPEHLAISMANRYLEIKRSGVL